MRITAVCWMLLVAGPSFAADKEESFEPLFNGKDLSGWTKRDTKTDVWRVEKGMIVCAGPNGGWLGTDRDYDNFVVRLEYRLTPGGNSGVYLRAPDTGWISRIGMEIQILDDLDPKYAKNPKIAPYQFTGSIYHVVPPSKSVSKAAGEWNALEIQADGRRIHVALNGIGIVDADLDHYLKDPAIAKEHPGLRRSTGKIGLQSHSERVEFRNIRIKVMK